MKRGVSVGLTVAAVIIVVGFAGYSADRAHGKLEGLINGAEDHALPAPAAGLNQNGNTSTYGLKPKTVDPPRATGPAGIASGQGQSPTGMQPRVDIGLKRRSDDGFEGGGEGRVRPGAAADR